MGLTAGVGLGFSVGLTLSVKAAAEAEATAEAEARQPFQGASTRRRVIRLLTGMTMVFADHHLRRCGPGTHPIHAGLGGIDPGAGIPRSHSASIAVRVLREPVHLRSG